MTTDHREILERAKRYEANPDNDPWMTRNGLICGVGERISRVRTMDAAKCIACLAWKATEQSVKTAIEARLRQLRRQAEVKK